MPEYVLNRDYVLRTTMGHTIAFKRGEPTWVPPVIERDAIAIGAERADNGKTELLVPEPVENNLSFEQLREQLRAAFELLVEKNDAADFTSQGVPRIPVLEKMLETNVDRRDVLEAWTEFRAGKAD
jgi:hypothetical protein